MKAYHRRAVVTCVQQSLLLDIVFLSQQNGKKFDSCLREFPETALHRCCPGRNRLTLTSLRIPRLKAAAKSCVLNLTIPGFHHAVLGHASAVQDFHYCLGA